VARIEAAKDAVTLAEAQLGEVTAEPQEVKSSGDVRAATSRLNAARAKLAHLNDLLAEAKLESARSAVTSAEKELDVIIQRMVVETDAEKIWATARVRNALSALRTAKVTLEAIEASVEGDED